MILLVILTHLSVLLLHWKSKFGPCKIRCFELIAGSQLPILSNLRDANLTARVLLLTRGLALRSLNQSHPLPSSFPSSSQTVRPHRMCLVNSHIAHLSNADSSQQSHASRVSFIEHFMQSPTVSGQTLFDVCQYNCHCHYLPQTLYHSTRSLT